MGSRAEEQRQNLAIGGIGEILGFARGQVGGRRLARSPFLPTLTEQHVRRGHSRSACPAHRWQCTPGSAVRGAGSRMRTFQLQQHALLQFHKKPLAPCGRAAARAAPAGGDGSGCGS